MLQCGCETAMIGNSSMAMKRVIKSLINLKVFFECCCCCSTIVKCEYDHFSASMANTCHPDSQIFSSAVKLLYSFACKFDLKFSISNSKIEYIWRCMNVEPGLVQELFYFYSCFANYGMTVSSPTKAIKLREICKTIDIK